MIQGRVFIATSLDGFIARRNGDLDWLPGLSADGGDYGYGDFMDTVDGLVMGRGSFEKVQTFDEWPYPKPVIVLSRSLTVGEIRPDLADKVSISAEPPRALMQALEDMGWKGVYVDGGQVIQSFLRERLITDLTISRIPVLIGDGIPLFGTLATDIALDHQETRAYASGLVQSRYKLRKQGDA